MKVLITGAAGFVGPYVIKEFVRHGHTVTMTSLRPFDLKIGNKQLTSLACDLTSEKAVEELMKRARPDTVIHLAGVSRIVNASKNPAHVMESNALTTERLCSAINKIGKPTNFLLVSSAMVYSSDKKDSSIDEKTPTDPNTPYGESKLAAERIVNSHEGPTLKGYIARSFNHTGPGQSTDFVVPALAQRIINAKEGDTLPVGNTTSKRDFSDVRDMARAYRLIIEKQPNERLFVLGSGTATTVGQLIEEFKKISKKKVVFKQDADLLQLSGPKSLVSHPTLAQKVLKWKTQIPLKKTLSDVYSTQLDMHKKQTLSSSQAYPLAQSTFSKDEITAAKKVLDSGRFTMGPQVEAFEKEFASWIGVPYALMVNSGSSANLLMVEALLRSSKGNPKLKVGDEVLVPALAWPTTVWPLLQLGLVPVFVDIDPITMAVDIESMRKCLTSKTKAIFLIHVLGQIADMKAIIEFCSQNHLLLLEDVCESLGAYHNKSHAGTFGVMGSYSCYFSHHISTIEGGLIVTSDPELYDDLKSLRSHGWIRGRSDMNEWATKHPEIDPRFMFIMAGYNVRSTDIQAAIGRVQLKKLDAMLIAREKMARGTNKIVKKYAPWVRLVGAHHLESGKKTVSRSDRAHSWMSLPFLLTNDAPVNVNKVKALLEEHGIETRPIIAGNFARHPSSQAYKIRSAPSLTNADNALKNGFMIGCHPFGWEKNLKLLEKAFSKIAQL